MVLNMPARLLPEHVPDLDEPRRSELMRWPQPWGFVVGERKGDVFSWQLALQNHGGTSRGLVVAFAGDALKLISLDQLRAFVGQKPFDAKRRGNTFTFASLPIEAPVAHRKRRVKRVETFVRHEVLRALDHVVLRLELVGRSLTALPREPASFEVTVTSDGEGFTLPLQYGTTAAYFDV